MDDRIRNTIVCHPLREAVLRAAVAALELPPAGHGLDAGCGIGLVTVLLAEAELEPADRRLYRKLCLPDSPDFILNLPDYYAFFTYSMFSGKVHS